MDKPPIVEVISKYVDLRRSGREFSGICPLHSEKTASFTVNEEKQVFYCHGCCLGGDIIRFIELIENTDFKGALDFLNLSDQSRPTRFVIQKKQREKETAKVLTTWALIVSDQIAARMRQVGERVRIAQTILRVFGIGAFSILYSSTLAAIAARARYIPDYLIELGFTTRDRVDLRRKIIRWYCLIVPFIGLGLYVGFQRPVLMVTIAACYAALMLPIQSGITIYLQAKRLPVQVQPKWPARYFLRLTFVVQLVLACAVIYFVIL